MTLDPLQSEYPGMSPYHAMANSPTWYVDGDGRDNIIYIFLNKDFEKAALKNGFNKKVIREEITTLLSVHGLSEGTVDVVFTDKFVEARELDHSDTFVAVGFSAETTKLLGDIHTSRDEGINYPKNIPTTMIGVAATTEGIDAAVFELTGLEVTEHTGGFNERRFVLVNGHVFFNHNGDLIDEGNEKFGTVVVHEMHHGTNVEHKGDKVKEDEKTIFAQDLDDAHKNREKSSARTRKILKQNFNSEGTPKDNRERNRKRKNSDKGRKFE